MRCHSRFMGLPVLALVGFSIPALASTEAANTVSLSSTLQANYSGPRDIGFYWVGPVPVTIRLNSSCVPTRPWAGACCATSSFSRRMF